MSARSFDLTGTKSRFGNVTVLHSKDSISVILHRTIVVHADLAAGTVMLNSGGWRTPTTKTAINNALGQLKANASVSQVKGQWLVRINGQSMPFTDGMTIGMQVQS